MSEFLEFQKIPRLSRECVVTEKIDGTNACIYIHDDFTTMEVGSRSRWLDAQNDNHGFFKWTTEQRDELLKLGPGRHYGEWWGSGIQRGYGLVKGEKRFSLFNTGVWNKENVPSCCSVVPILYQGMFDTRMIEEVVESLRFGGSQAAPGFMKPEGVVVFHIAARLYFKKTVEKDESPKGKTE